MDIYQCYIKWMETCPSKAFASNGIKDTTHEDFDCSSFILDEVQPTRESILSGDEKVIKELDYFFEDWGSDPKDDIDFIDWIVEEWCSEEWNYQG